MSATEGYASYIMMQLRALEGVTIRKMMGGHVLHLRGRVLGFIFGESLILEDGPTIRRLLPDAERAPLFPGSKDFIIFPDPSNSHLLCSVCEAIYDDLPIPKPRKGRKGNPVRSRPSGKSGARKANDDIVSDFLEFRSRDKSGKHR